MPVREIEVASVNLDALGIKRDAPLLLSPGTPFKYAPQHDWVFPAIARRLGRCTIAFFRDMSVPWNSIYDGLFSRLAAAFSAGGMRFEDHCVVLPWLEKPEFYGLMQRADVML